MWAPTLPQYKVNFPITYSFSWFFLQSSVKYPPFFRIVYAGKDYTGKDTVGGSKLTKCGLLTQESLYVTEERQSFSGWNSSDRFQKSALNESHYKIAYFSLITVRKPKVNNSMWIT